MLWNKQRSLFLCGLSLLTLLNGSSDGVSSDEFDERPRDCTDHNLNGNFESGVYTIFIKDERVNVFCDMETDGGGWTVIQRRGDFKPNENFNRDWHDYKKGFGNNRKEFWLGNDYIHTLTTQVPTEIRFDLKDVRGNTRFAKYSSFHIDDESNKYTLHISGYSGDAGNGMRQHDGQEFSTKDRGNYDAVRTLQGAWWIYEWAFVHLNGVYAPGEDDFTAIHWYKWLQNEGLAFTEMKIRQK